MNDQRLDATPEPASYEPPRLERVVTPDELEQEILYAGQDTSVDGQT